MQYPTEITSDAHQSSVPGGASVVDDLVQLETYYRQRGLEGEELTSAELSFIVALARYRFDPPTSPLLAERGQVMVLGGAGAGKSTTANIVAGASIAEVNPQAGFTRHPTAIFRAGDDPTHEWPARLGPLVRWDRPQAGNVDQDSYSVRRVYDECADPDFLTRRVVWDCPDLTAKDATYYEGRVIEIAALADLCIYVASDERYNDELPTNFVQGLLEAGKPVLVVLTKVSADEGPELVELFRRQVLDRLAAAEHVVDIYVIPSPQGTGLAMELWKPTYPHGEHLRGTIDRVLNDLATCRKNAARHAAHFLWDRRHRVLDPLARDLGEWRLWVEMVRRANHAALDRYQREYLDRSATDEFQDARDAILNVLPLPGRWGAIWRVLEYFRVPYRMVKSVAARYTDRRSAGPVNEEVVLDRVRQQLFDSLVVTVSMRRGRHGFWDALHASLLDPSQLTIESAFQDLRAKQLRELRLHRRDAYDRMDMKISQRPVLIWAIRIGRLALDLGAIVAAVWLGFYLFESFSLFILVLVFLGLGLVDDLVRVMCQEFVRREREDLLVRQKENVRALFDTAYVSVLSRLPRNLGDRLAKLSEIAERLPQSLAALVNRFRREGAA